jgi:hypothetical protein
MSAATPRIAKAEVEQQHRAILSALDKLYEYEVPLRSSRPALRLVAAGEGGAGPSEGEELRASIVRRGWDLWAFGGELELFGAMRAVMAARPYRQKWNRTVLSGLWLDIGMPERKGA